jgi:hypothetical protein
MAIGNPVEIGRNHTTGTASTTLAITLATAVSAGDLIIVVAVNHNTAAVVATDVSDSGGTNAYTLITVANASACSALLAYQGNAAALSIGATITVTYPSARNIAAIAYKVSGAAASPFDVSATNAQASATALTVGPTGTTAQANELVIGCFTWSGTHTITAGNPYTAGTKEESTTTIRGVAAEWKIVSATGTQTATATLNTASVGAHIVATFKEASGSTFTEAGEGDTAAIASGADTEAATDAGQGISARIGSGADAQTVAEAGQGTSALTGSGADTQAVTEAGQAASPRVGGGADVLSLSEAGQAASPFASSGADVFATTEAGQAAAALTASGADAIVMVDAGGGVLVPLGSGADAFSGTSGYTEAGQADAILLGAGADAIVMVDAGGGVLLAVGSGATDAALPQECVVGLPFAVRHAAARAPQRRAAPPPLQGHALLASALRTATPPEDDT